MGTTKVRFRMRMAGFPHMEADVAPARADAMILGGLAYYVDGVKPPGLIRREIAEAEAERKATKDAERNAVAKIEADREASREVATDKPKRGRRKMTSTEPAER